MTAQEVCELLRINRRTLQRWCHAKPPKISYIRFSSNKIGFRRQLIEYFLKQHEIQGGVYYLTAREEGAQQKAGARKTR